MKSRGIIAAIVLAASGATYAGVFTLVSPVAGSDALSTSALALNDSGTVGGSYTTAGGTLTHGFVGALGGPYATFDYAAPGFSTVFTQVRGMNNAGDAVGWAQDALGNAREFLRKADGTITTLVNPAGGNPLNYIGQGINSAGLIVGSDYGSGPMQGFILSADGSSLTTLAFPGSVATQARGINDSGTVVGFYRSGGKNNGFMLAGGTYSTIDDPLGFSGSGTVLESIDNVGDISGIYTDAGNVQHGFLYDIVTSAFTSIDVPGSGYTQAFQVNDFGQVALASDNGSYIWSPNALNVPEPTTVSLLALALFGLAYTRRRLN